MSRQPRRAPVPTNQGGAYSNLTGDQPLSPSLDSPLPSSRLNPDRQYDPPRARAESDGRESGSTVSDGSGGVASVMSGAVGGSYGPYSYSPVDGRGLPPPSFSNHSRPESSNNSHTSRSGSAIGLVAQQGPMRPAPTWTARDAELDDRLHNASPSDKFRERSCVAFSARGWLNMTALVFLVGGLITLFAGYPIIQYVGRPVAQKYGAFNVGGINATGQVPFINNLPTLIDAQTPANALSRTGFDGKKYVLMFSDEFNTDDRTYVPPAPLERC